MGNLQLHKAMGGTSWSAYLLEKTVQVGGAVMTACNMTPSLPISEQAGYKYQAIENGSLQISDWQGERFAVRNASKEWFKKVVTEINDNKSVPEEVKEMNAMKLTLEAATGKFDVGDNKYEYTKAQDGSHVWFVTAFEQSKQAGKVNFFISWAKFKCKDKSSDVLAAELIRRSYIGYDKQSKTFKYLAN